jgi:hypothetical protein
VKKKERKKGLDFREAAVDLKFLRERSERKFRERKRRFN